MKTVAFLSLILGCAASENDTSGTSEVNNDATDASNITGEDDVDNAEDSAPPESEDNAVCSEDYSLCGDIEVPSGFSGSTRSLAIVLYSSVPPAGPPDGIIAEIESPDLNAGGTFPVRVLPALFNGDYYVWVNLYMEGGGEWLPVNGIDYTGSTSEPISFDGSPVSFDDISLSLATDW